MRQIVSRGFKGKTKTYFLKHASKTERHVKVHCQDNSNEHRCFGIVGISLLLGCSSSDGHFGTKACNCLTIPFPLPKQQQQRRKTHLQAKKREQEKKQMTVGKKRRSMIRRDTKPPVWIIVEKLACYKSCPSIW